MVLFGFALFCTGLAALTLFPLDFWNGVWAVLKGKEEWISLAAYYPGPERFQYQLEELSRNLVPFHEIRRFLWGGPWIRLMFWGNIGMFVPIGFCSALLGGREHGFGRSGSAFFAPHPLK